MDRQQYLREVAASGKAHMAPTIAEALAQASYHGVDSFQGMYYDLALMELVAAEGTTAPIREHIMDKALQRIDTRLDCADFIIPGLIRMLMAHRGTERLSEALAARIEKSLIGFKYWLDEPGDIKACFFTENHQILFHSCEYLVGQMFPEAVFPNNGMTGREHQAHGEAFLRRWLDWRIRFGFA